MVHAEGDNDGLQGLDINSDGSIVSAPNPTLREHYKAEQEDWAANTDTRSAEIKERIVHRAGTAGAALFFCCVGKKAEGGWDHIIFI